MPKILVVDDEKDVCDTLKDIFIKEGYEVETALSGKEAIFKVQTEKPDLILLDIRMPEMGGIEVLKKVKEIDNDIPVAIITAHEDIEAAKEAMQLGAYDYIRKPFNIKYVRASVLSKLIPEGINDSTDDPK